MIVVMYVVKVPNRGSPPAILLRESYREAGKVKNRTLANLSAWPEAKVQALSRVLKGQPPPAADLDGAFEITRSLPHGHDRDGTVFEPTGCGHWSLAATDAGTRINPGLPIADCERLRHGLKARASGAPIAEFCAQGCSWPDD
jgi:hypothetical protein